MPIEYERPDVLQNMEHVVVSYYKSHKEMSDYDVLRVYEDLMEDYRNEQEGKPLKHHNQSELEQYLYENIKTICEWHLGRGLLDVDAPPFDVPEPITIETLLRCLKRLIKSVKLWNKAQGRQGYLNFIIQHVL